MCSVSLLRFLFVRNEAIITKSPAGCDSICWGLIDPVNANFGRRAGGWSGRRRRVAKDAGGYAIWDDSGSNSKAKS